MTVVVDASVLVDLALGESGDDRLIGGDMCAPHLVDAEVGSALRRLLQLKRITLKDSAVALERYASTTFVRYTHPMLMERAWQLRNNASFYDGLYIALAEALDAPLLTRDARLAAVPGTRATIELLV